VLPHDRPQHCREPQRDRVLQVATRLPNRKDLVSTSTFVCRGGGLRFHPRRRCRPLRAQAAARGCGGTCAVLLWRGAALGLRLLGRRTGLPLLRRRAHLRHRTLCHAHKETTGALASIVYTWQPCNRRPALGCSCVNIQHSGAVQYLVHTHLVRDDGVARPPQQHKLHLISHLRTVKDRIEAFRPGKACMRCSLFQDAGACGCPY